MPSLWRKVNDHSGSSRGSFFSSLPSFGLTSTEGKISLAFNAFGPGSTELEKSILARLDQLGLPRNLDGVLELGAGFLTPAGFGPNLFNLRELNKEVAYLNKIVSTVSRLPDLSEHLLPKIEESFSTRPVIGSIEDYNKIWPNLPSGQEYIVMGTDGNPIVMKKGFESFLFKGTEGE